MKRHMTATLLVVLGLAFVCGGTALERDAVAQRGATQEKITVLNPLGIPPPVQLKLRAPRLDTLDGKTIYFINTGFPGTERLMAAMIDWFNENHPTTTIEYRISGGGMTGVDKKLWAEMEERADAAILGLGH